MTVPAHHPRAGRAALRRLPLLWRLLIPSLVVTLALGSTGAFVLVRYLHRGAQAAVDRRAFTDTVAAQVQMRDQVLALLEAVRLAGNLQGVPEAIAARDRTKLASLLAGVPALRDHVDLLVATDPAGLGLVELHHRAGQLTNSTGRTWDDRFIEAARRGLTDAEGDKWVGFTTVDGHPLLGVATPIRVASHANPSDVAGVVIAGADLEVIARGVAERIDDTVAIAELDGSVLAAPAPASPRRIEPVRTAQARRGHGREHGRQFVDAPLALRGEVPAATLRIGVATAPYFAPVRGGEWRILALIALVMVGVVGIATLLTRYVTRQMRPLVEANRALGRGDLAARAPVLASDELGEVAAGLNTMAEQLQASYAELEMRVEARTEELQRVYDQLSAVLQARTEVFAAISHEFRSPLFAILGHADLMADPNFKPGHRRWRTEFADTIRTSAQMLLGRVNALLEIARVESRDVELDLESVAIADVVADIRPTARALARRGDLDFSIDVAPGLPPVDGDRQRLREILLNVVSNAVKYTPAGGAVRINVQGAADSVRITVSDTGVGIPSGIGERIFEPFYRVRGNETQDGQPSSGLGLALVQRLVRAHAGDVGFESEPGRGTTFTITLPARNRASAGSGAADRIAAVKANHQPSDGKSEGDSWDAECIHRGLHGEGPRLPAPSGSV